MAYIDQTQLEARLSVETVRQILDDDQDGMADGTAVTRICADASSYVAATLQPVYTPWPLTAPYPEEVIRLTLDAAEAYAAKRHPEYVRRDWQKLFQHLDLQLDRLYGQRRSLAQEPPDPVEFVVAYSDARRGW